MPFTVDFLDDGHVLEWEATADGTVVTEREDYTPRFYVAACSPDADIDLCQSEGFRFGVVSLNCEAPKSLDTAVYRLVRCVAEDVGAEIGVPGSGVSTDRNSSDSSNSSTRTMTPSSPFSTRLSSSRAPAYSSLLYQLSRAENLGNIEGSDSVTALTNYTHFMQDLNSRAKSSFNPDDIFFDDYDANQLRSPLQDRTDAFKENSLEDDVIPLVAAFGSQTHGDARKAIDLFRWTGEFAERRGSETVNEQDVRSAQDKYDENRTLRHISGLATQKKLHYMLLPLSNFTLSEMDVDGVPWWLAVQDANWFCPFGPGSNVVEDDLLMHPVVHDSWNDATAFAE